MIKFILGIVISVPLTLIAEKIARAYICHRDKRLISKVFPFTSADTQLEVKCSLKKTQDGKNPPSLRTYVHSAETLALQKIAKHLHGHDVALNVGSFYSIPQEEKNLLLIGAASYNELSKHILECIDGFSIYHYDNHHARYEHNGEIYECVHKEFEDGSKVTDDYGLVVRKKLSDGHYVLLLGGIHMHGTLAAADVAITRDFQRKIRKKKLREFIQLVRVRVADDGLSLIKSSIEWDNLPLIEIGRDE